MSFAADAIGFYLDLDDTLTPKLGAAVGAYGQAVKLLTGYNTKIQQQANKGIGAFAKLAESMGDAAKGAVSAYAKARDDIEAKA